MVRIIYIFFNYWNDYDNRNHGTDDLAIFIFCWKGEAPFFDHVFVAASLLQFIIFLTNYGKK
jgi:hypothetical protein